MNSKTKLIIIIISLIVVIGGGTYLYNAISNLDFTIDNREQKEESKKAMPEAIIYDEQDNEINTLTFKGKPTIVNFWTTWCTYCEQEMPSFEKAYNQYKDEVNFVLVDVLDSQEETKENGINFKNEHNLSMPIYFDRNHQAVAKFGAPGFPTTFFIDKNGNIYKIVISMLTEEKLLNYIENLINVE